MRFYLAFLTCLFFSCTTPPLRPELKQESGIKSFLYEDAQGKFLLKREVKKEKGRLITRSRLFSWEVQDKELETTVSVYKIGRVSKSLALRPEASQFKVWFDKEAFTSQMEILSAKRMIAAKLNSPEKKWNGVQESKIPKGRFFCFFSSLPECLKMQNILFQAREKKVIIHLIWDNYPYNREQFTDIPLTMVSEAIFSYSDKVDETLRFELDIGNQIIFYHFDREFEFVKMFWISQGLSVEEISKRGTQ